MKNYNFLYQTNLSNKAISVYLYLDARANRSGRCWPAIPTIADDLHLSPSTIRRCLKELREAGLLTTCQRLRPNGGKSSLLYELKGADHHV